MAQGPQKWYIKFFNSLLCASNNPEAPKKTWGRKCVDCLKPTIEEEQQEERHEGPRRETWGNRCTFFISTLGMSVGLGQVWRFPTLAYAQGGGAFLIMYGIMIFLFGNALFFFEVSNGQYTSKNPLKVFDKVPIFIGIGWAMISYSYLFCTYYSHMVAFSMYYFYRSFTPNMPWTYCPELPEDDHYDKYACVPYPKLRNPEFDGVICGNETLIYNHTELCINRTYSEERRFDCCFIVELAYINVYNERTYYPECFTMFNISKLCRPREYPSTFFWNHEVNRVYREGDKKHGYLGPINYWMCVSSLLTWIIAYFTLYKGIKSLGVLMYIMVPLPYIVLFIMLGVVVPQKGATYGLKQFFIPKARSFIDINVWRVATEQAFYSIGVAMGPLITFGSYSRFDSPSHIDGALICLCIFLTSILCSLVVFSVLGFLSHKTGRPFEKVVEAGPGLVFIVYPESLELLPAAQFFSALFYLMLINLGLSSVTGIIETVSSAVYDIWPKTRKFKYVVNLVVLSSSFLIGLPITARGGLSVYDCFDQFSAGIPLIPICALEMLAVVYVYGIGRFCEDINFMLGFYPNRYYRWQWLIGPFILFAIFIYGMVMIRFGDAKPWAIGLGWFLFFCVMGWIFVGTIYTIVTYLIKDDLENIINPPSDHGPKNPSDKSKREGFSVKRKIC